MKRVLVACCVLCVLAAPLSAQTATWTGAVSTDYYNNANWQGGILPSIGGTILFSAAATNHTIDLFGLNSNGVDTIRFDHAGLGTFTMQNGNLGLQGNNLIEVLAIVPTAQTINMNLTLTGAGAFRNNGTNLLTIGGNVSLNGQLSVDGSGNTLIAGNISGTGPLVKSNGGLLILTGNYSAGGITAVSAGTLQIGNGGTSGSIINNINNNSSVIFNRSDNSLYLATLLGTGNVTKSGAGTLTLGSSNSYTGATIINGGTLNVSSLANAGSSSSIGAASIAASNLVLDGGTLRNNSSTNQATNRLFTLGPGGGTLDGGGFLLSFTGVGAIATTGSGTRTLTLTGDVQSSNLDLNLADASPGAVSLVKTGTASWILNGAHTYSGTTTVQAGQLTLSGSSGSPNSAYSLAVGAALILEASPTLGSLTGNGLFRAAGFGTTSTASIGSNGSSTTFSGTMDELSISGSILVLNKVGSGTLTLTGANTYSGGTTISSGALAIGNGGTTGSIIGNINNNSILIFNRSDAVTFGGSISGSGSLSKNGTGTLTLTAANTYTGGTAILGGMLEVALLANGGTASAIGAAPNSANNLFFDGGTLRFTGAPGAGSTDCLFTITTAGATLDASGAGLLFFSNTGNIDLPTLNVPRTLTLTGSGIGELRSSLANSGLAPTNITKSGSGGWILSSASNSFSGNVNVQDGTLAVSAGATGNNAAYTIDPGAIVSVIGSGVSLGSLAGGGTLRGLDSGPHATTVGGNNASTTFGGIIVDNTGVVSLTKTGTGTLTLTGTNTYTGNTTINNGILQLGNGGTTGSIVGNILNDANVTFNRSDNITYVGNISGTGGVTKTGSGRLTLAGNHNYHSPTNINGGTLNVTGSLSSDTTVFVNNSGTLSGTGTINGPVNINNLGTVAPGNSVGQLNVGHTQLNIASFYQFEYKSSAVAPVAGVDNDLLFGLTGTTLNLNFSSPNPSNITISAVLTGQSPLTPVTYTIARFDTITGAPFGDISNRFNYMGDFLGTPIVMLIDGATFDTMTLTFTPVPEPATVLSICAGVSALGMVLRRKWRSCLKSTV